jgi:proteasome lid subunit RPN8/RPN11
MIGIVQIEKSVADSILSSATDAYPKEAILLLRGKVEENRILISEVVIPPLSTHGMGFSSFPHIMLPMDLSVMGISHSHPSGNLQPSIHDMNHFYGRIMVIAAHPFQSYDDIGVFNKKGDRVLLEIVPDHAPSIDQ